jgi:FKBP-type peptidyl-prolyl cis-trans isomerase SlyD
MNIEDKCAVSIHYTLTNEQGDKLDSSEGQDPLRYLHGARNIIPGLEAALAGKSAGDQLTVTIQPEDAYGEINPEMIQVVPREAFQGIDDVQPGMQFQASGPDGQAQVVTIRAVGEEGITVDGNHPLAGQVLNFDVTVEDVREATKEELEHGHVH